MRSRCSSGSRTAPRSRRRSPPGSATRATAARSCSRDPEITRLIAVGLAERLNLRDGLPGRPEAPVRRGARALDGGRRCSPGWPSARTLPHAVARPAIPIRSTDTSEGSTVSARWLGQAADQKTVRAGTACADRSISSVPSIDTQVARSASRSSTMCAGTGPIWCPALKTHVRPTRSAQRTVGFERRLVHVAGEAPGRVGAGRSSRPDRRSPYSRRPVHDVGEPIGGQWYTHRCRAESRAESAASCSATAARGRPARPRTGRGSPARRPPRGSHRRSGCRTRRASDEPERRLLPVRVGTGEVMVARAHREAGRRVHQRRGTAGP